MLVKQIRVVFGNSELQMLSCMDVAWSADFFTYRVRTQVFVLN